MARNLKAVMADTKDTKEFSGSSAPQGRGPLPFEARDLPVMLLCLLGAAFCFWMFWADFNRTMDRLAEPIGTITYKRQAAQRRFTDRVLWIRLSKGAPVYQGDYIRTAELSQATMHFGDGADIDLAENTLIQLRVEDGKNVVDLSGGNLSVAVSDGDLRILVSGENRVEIGAGAALSATADPSGVFSMQVLEGEVTANGKSFASGEAFSSDPLAAWAAPLSPRADAYVSAGGTLAFSWSAQNYSGPTRFELARDRRFRRPEKSLAIGEESLLLKLDPGMYWWRVYPEQSGQSGESSLGGSAPRKITVIPQAPPRLISPAEGQHFYPGTEIRFFWKSGTLPPEIQDTGSYTLELSDSSVFEAPLVSFDVEGTESGSLLYSRLTEGTWYWRVRQLFPGLERAAAPLRFTVASEAPEPAAPEPVVPEPVAPKPEPATQSVTAAVVTDSPRPPPQRITAPLPSPSGMDPPNRFTAGPEAIRRSRRMVFSWNGVEGANSYVFSLFEDSESPGTRNSGGGAGGATALLSVETAETSYTIEDLGLLGNGSFVWRVEAVVKNGGVIERRGTPGESRFTIDVPAPGNPRIRETGVLYGL